MGKSPTRIDETRNIPGEEDMGNPGSSFEQRIGDFSWGDFYPSDTAKLLRQHLAPITAARGLRPMRLEIGRLCIVQGVPEPLPFDLSTAASVRFWRGEINTPESFDLNGPREPTRWGYDILEEHLPDTEDPRDVRQHLRRLADGTLHASQVTMAELPETRRIRLERCLMVSLRFLVHTHTQKEADKTLRAAGKALVMLWAAGTPFVGINKRGTPLIGLLGTTPS
ncbi:MAG: hypothetical protein KC653_02045 [Candidatus Andersenbacteria bacterium]|nr:hypothetical protein [Candidatus Andersenbacteria bacterium]